MNAIRIFGGRVPGKGSGSGKGKVKIDFVDGKWTALTLDLVNYPIQIYTPPEYRLVKIVRANLDPCSLSFTKEGGLNGSLNIISDRITWFMSEHINLRKPVRSVSGMDWLWIYFRTGEKWRITYFPRYGGRRVRVYRSGIHNVEINITNAMIGMSRYIYPILTNIYLFEDGSVTMDLLKIRGKITVNEIDGMVNIKVE